MGDIGPPCADAHIYIPQTAADTNQRRLVEPSAVYVNSVWLSFSAGGAKEILDSVADVHRVKAICLDALAVALKRHDAVGTKQRAEVQIALSGVSQSPLPLPSLTELG